MSQPAEEQLLGIIAEKDRQIAELQARVTQLEARVAELEQLLEKATRVMGVMGDGPHFLRSLSGSHARFSKSHGHSSGLRPQHIYPTHEGPQLSFGVASSGCVSGDYYARYGREGQGEKRVAPGLIMDD